ncbi:MAG: aspartate/glutamate racemase family protein [Eubacterium sp.]|jgi:aspartate racemase
MLGIIGGMGPAASSLFYDMITEKTHAEKDQDNLDLILISHASMDDRTAAILSGDQSRIDALAQKLKADALMLANAGVSDIVVTCNTAHYFIDMIEKDIPVPFIHLIRETSKRVSEAVPGGKVAVLGTDGTIRTELYQKELSRAGVTPYVPSEETQSLVMHEIYDCVKAGKRSDRAAFFLIDHELKVEDCDAAVLACTELSVLRRELNISDFYFDPMDIAADACIAFAREHGEIK